MHIAKRMRWKCNNNGYRCRACAATVLAWPHALYLLLFECPKFIGELFGFSFCGTCTCAPSNVSVCVCVCLNMWWCDMSMANRRWISSFNELQRNLLSIAVPQWFNILPFCRPTRKSFRGSSPNLCLDGHASASTQKLLHHQFSCYFSSFSFRPHSPIFQQQSSLTHIFYWTINVKFSLQLKLRTIVSSHFLYWQLTCVSNAKLLPYVIVITLHITFHLQYLFYYYYDIVIECNLFATKTYHIFNVQISN